MKARKVKVDPEAPFGEAIRCILAVRLDELHSLAAQPDSLHDTRIAAKRVRYVLEIAEPVLGAGAEAALKAAKETQDLLGEINDCDELLPLVDRHIERLRAEDVEAARSGEPLPHRRKYRGLEALRALTTARRELLHGEFERRWPKLAKQMRLKAVVPA